MRIQLLFFAELRERFGSRIDTDVAEGARAGEIARQYDLAGLPLLFAVNESFVSAETTLQENDTLAFLMPMSGGCR